MMREERAQYCTGTHSVMTKRHHAIKALLAHTCRQIPSVMVETEATMGRDEDTEERNTSQTIADITLTMTTSLSHPFITKVFEKTGEGTQMICLGVDIIISQDFSSRTPITLENTNPTKRVEQGENQKKRVYKKHGQTRTIIRIAFSDNGHMGPNTLYFLDLLKVMARDSGVPNPVPPFLATTSVILEHARSFAEEEYLDLLHKLDKIQESTLDQNRTITLT
ncbi:hypothetical protein BLNAU_15491 [Blattamonas nauphoetae]|uniref:Uncharacterized protein n=1 Tax=Blattamonas nauphoetae TaxID=2049346 RepID=A0ABQ9XH56_9EUKA|nr:hypothetical protein BLNAU_15491 [Blattamonas nauphoetae]